MAIKNINQIIKALIFICFLQFLIPIDLCAGLEFKKNVRLINPLRKFYKFKELRPFKSRIENYIKQQKEKGLADEVAVYFRSLSDGAWFGIKEKEKFDPASLMKTPLMVAFFKKAEKDPRVLQQKVKYQDISDVSLQIIKPEVEFTPGEYYSVDQLIRAMIMDSDNNSFLTLLANIDENLLREAYINLGLAGAFSEEDDYVSLKSMVGVIRVLYNASYLNEKMSKKALEHLINTKYNDGIVASLPKDIIVAHKFAERVKKDTGLKQLHDIGIVYYSSNPYLLGIMTKGKDFAGLSKVIRDISYLIYSEVDKQYKDEGQNYAIGED